MFEEFLIVPQQAIQIRQPKAADATPECEDMGWRDHVDWVPLNKTEVADHGENRFTCRTRRQFAGKALLCDNQTPCEFQRHRDRRFTQGVRATVHRGLKIVPLGEEKSTPTPWNSAGQRGCRLGFWVVVRYSEFVIDLLQEPILTASPSHLGPEDDPLSPKFRARENEF